MLNHQCAYRGGFVALSVMLLVACTTSGAQSEALPLRKLPVHVGSTAGVVTVYADFEQITPPASAHMTAQVPLYVVNRTEAPLPLSQQDWDSYFQAEVEVEGKWKRTNPFAFSWCGNSYDRVTVPPDHYMVLTGFMPEPGEAEAPIRFRRTYDIDHPLVSNEATATFQPEQVKAARYDALAVRGDADADTLMEIMEGRSPIEGEVWGATPSQAAEALGSRYPDRALEWVAAQRAAGAADAGTLAAALSGVMGHPETPFDVAFDAYQTQLQFEGDHGDAYALASHFPAEALERRDDLKAVDAERRRLEMLRLESAIFRHAPAELLEQVLRGQVETRVYPEEEMVNYALHRLPDEFPDVARRLTEEFKTSPSQKLNGYADALQACIEELAK